MQWEQKEIISEEGTGQWWSTDLNQIAVKSSKFETWNTPSKFLIRVS